MGEVALMSPTLPSGITDSISDSHWRNSDEENILLSSVESSPFLHTVESDTSCYSLRYKETIKVFTGRSPLYVPLQRLIFSPTLPGPV